MTADATPSAAPGASPAVDPHAESLAALAKLLGPEGFTTARFRDNLRIYLTADRLIKALQLLRDECGFKMLAELGGSDYLKYPGKRQTPHRFEVHYVLRNLDTNETLVIKVGVDDPDPTIPSAVPLWLGADWMEREVFDMYGIQFEGHPDLRRILMPDEFSAFPLRKDYPLRGRGERHNFPKLTREQS
jgi:NADH-quinone oxidoreductase subunit C